MLVGRFSLRDKRLRMRRLRKSSVNSKRYPSAFYHHNGQFKDPVLEILRANQPPVVTPLPQIGIPGIQRIFDSKCNQWVRIVWFIILITTSIGCFYQLFLRFQVYFQYPTFKDVRVIKSPTITFPYIVICPAFLRTSFYSLLNSRNDTCQKGLATECVSDLDAKYVLDIANYSSTTQTADELWEKYFYITPDSIKVYEACSASNSSVECNPDYGQERHVSVRNLTTFWGQCLVLSTNITVDYRGIFTYLRIKFRDHVLENWMKTKNNSIKYKTNNRTVSALFYIRDYVVNKHEAFYFAQDTLHGFSTDIRLSMKKFAYKSTAKNKCIDREQYEACISKCFNSNMENTVKCRLPFMDSNLSSCVLDGIYEFYRRAYLVYSLMNETKCGCYKPCEETSYSTIYDVTDRVHDDSSVVLKYYFNDNSCEHVQEDFSYTKSALVSDIGGGLGFFLGFCCLTLAEVLEYFLQWIGKHFNNLRYLMKRLKLRRSLKKRLASIRVHHYRKR